MEQSKKLCIDYAKNRAELREINIKLSEFALVEDEKGYCVWVDVAKFRTAYYEEDIDPSLENYPKWGGWVCALKTVGDFSPVEMEFAKLLDRKKKVLRRAGQIKRNISAHGRSLLKKGGE